MIILLWKNYKEVSTISVSYTHLTKGSICIFSEKSKVVFTGDTIFDTDLGRTDLSDGSEDLMKKSVIEIIDKWDNDITIYPGHDQGCTMKCVRRNNFEFLTLRNGHERE